MRVCVGIYLVVGLDIEQQWRDHTDCLLPANVPLLAHKQGEREVERERWREVEREKKERGGEREEREVEREKRERWRERREKEVERGDKSLSEDSRGTPDRSRPQGSDETWTPLETCG